MSNEAVILKQNFFAMRLCIPSDWTNSQIIKFAENQNPCNTRNGWSVAEDGDSSLGKCSARIQCSDKETHTHVVVVA